MKKIINENRWWLLGAAWLYTLTFVFSHYWSQSSSYDSIAHSISQRIDKRLSDFDKLCQDEEAVRSLQGFRPDEASKYIDREDAFYFLYADSHNGMKLQYWSNAMVIPPVENIPYRDTIKLVQYANGTYIFASHKVANSLNTLVQLILVQQKYFIQNDNYLKTSFSGYPSLEKYVDISSSPTPFDVKTKKGQVLFYLKTITNQPIVVFNWPSFLVEMAVTILLLVFFYRVGLGLAHNRKWLQAFIWIGGAAFLLEFCITYINFPVNVSNIEIFDKEIGNGFLLSSIGSLLLSLLLLTWVVYFTIRTRHRWMPQLENLSVRKKRRIAIGSLLGLLIITFLLSQLVIKLVQLPDVSFDVANFFSLGWNTISAIACLYFICVLHYRTLYLSKEIATRLWPQKWYVKYLILAACGLLILSLTIYIVAAKILVIILVWLLVSVMLEDQLPRIFFHNMERSVRFVFWLIWYAIFSTLLVQSQHSAKDLDQKIKTAKLLVNNYDTELDKTVDHVLSSTVINKFINKPFDAENYQYNNFIRDSIITSFNQNLIGFTTKTFLFDTASNALQNEDSTSFATLNTIVEQQASKTLYPNIYIFKSSFDKLAYIIRQPLQSDSGINGYLFITASRNTNGTSTLVPELIKSLQKATDPSDLYGYAIYNNGILESYTHNYAFPTMLDVKQSDFRSPYITKPLNGENALWYKSGKKMIVIMKSTRFFNDFVTLFAYLFGCFIILYLTERLLGRLITSSYRLRLKEHVKATSIRGKIRRTVITISLISFVLIGIITIFFFVNRYQKVNNRLLTQLSNQVVDDLHKSVDSDSTIFNLNNVNPTHFGFSTNQLEFDFIAKLLNVDVNLYDVNGRIAYTSNPLIYKKEVISSMMNSNAFYNMSVKKQSQFIQTESIGQLEFLSIYLPFRSAEGKTLGYVNIPRFDSQLELTQEISNFLVTLVNLIAFISIIAGIVAFFITNSITFSFYTIGQKMKAVSLGKTNEPLEWNSNDEIGILIQEYNKMLEQLDESAKKLAISEREYAWREMAKQVAHEIKNPLTPMKLNLQYLQRQMENDSPNAKQIAAKMANTLVTQIDHLSNIASDFSQLARINVVRIENFDLHDVLHQIVMLYQMDTHICLEWQRGSANLNMNADRTQINRLFTNLIKNASEAIEDQEACIDITEQAEDRFVTVAITDNGPGIPEELKENLFRPNFTTKSSGTGLGLAICKDIAERAGGAIWFESGNGKPTTFYVKLPLA